MPLRDIQDEVDDVLNGPVGGNGGVEVGEELTHRVGEGEDEEGHRRADRDKRVQGPGGHGEGRPRWQRVGDAVYLCRHPATEHVVRLGPGVPVGRNGVPARGVDLEQFVQPSGVVRPDPHRVDGVQGGQLGPAAGGGERDALGHGLSLAAGILCGSLPRNGTKAWWHGQSPGEGGRVGRRNP